MRLLILVGIMLSVQYAAADDLEGQSEPFKSGWGVQCSDGKWYRVCPEKRAAESADQSKWDEAKFPRVGRNSTASSSQISRTSEGAWYVGGNLHKASVGQWKSGTPDNRLATAGDFAATILKGQFDSMTELKFHANELEVCISGAVKDVNIDNQPIAEIASACAIIMGWKSEG